MPTKLVACQELGTPRRYPGTALEHRHQALPLAEGGVEGRQVRNLECHDHHPDGAHADVHRLVLGTTRVNGADREERGHRLEQPFGQVVRRRLKDQPEADDEAGRPEQQLRQEGQGGGGREYRVLALVRPGETGDTPNRVADQAIDQQRRPFDASRSPRQDHGEQHAGGVQGDDDHAQGEEQPIHDATDTTTR